MLVNGAVYAAGQRLKAIELDQLPAASSEAEAFLWIALKDPQPDEIEKLQAHFALHPLAIEDAQNGHQRPKLEEYGSTLFSVIQLLHYNAGEISVGEIDIFVNQQFILSLRSRSEQDFLGVRRRCEDEPHLLKLGPGYVFMRSLTMLLINTSRSPKHSRMSSNRSKHRFFRKRMHVHRSAVCFN